MSIDEIKSLFNEYETIIRTLPNYRTSNDNDLDLTKMLKRREELEDFFAKNHLSYSSRLNVGFSHVMNGLFSEYDKIIKELPLLRTSKDDENVALLISNREKLEEVFAKYKLSYSVSIDSPFLGPECVRAFK